MMTNPNPHPLRIGMISPLFESVPPKYYGGTERVVANLCQGLKQAHIEVTLFASGDSQFTENLVAVTDQAIRLKPGITLEPHAYTLKMISLVEKQAARFDVIHNHHDYWMLPLSQMTPTPLLTTLHGRLDLPELPSAFESFPRSSYISISNAQRSPMKNLRWIDTIYHGLQLENYRYYENPGQYLAFLGRISPEKRPDWAIEIAKKSGVPLKIAAKIETGPNQDYFNSTIKHQIDGKFIEYVGEISEEEKSQFLGEAMALVFPIDWPEPFGLVMIESLATGTPVLARPKGSVPEILSQGVTGFIHDQIDDLAARVSDIPQLSRARCREWVETHFSLTKMTQQYIKAYQTLSDSNSK